MVALPRSSMARNVSLPSQCRLAASLAIAATTSYAGSPPQYDVIELQPLPGLFPIAIAHDIANSGESVGRTWKEEGGAQNHHGVLWSTDGSATDIGENGRWSEAFAISETGYIVGRHDVPAGIRGAIWFDGGRQMLPPLAGHIATQAFDIDNDGIPVGVSHNSVGDPTAVRWVDGVAQALPGASSHSWAFAVNGSGQAVGRRDIPTGRQAMLWEGDSFTILPDMGNDDLTSATNISDQGTICGGLVDTFGQLVSVLWAPGTHAITVLPDPGFGIFSQVRDVNDQGVAVGEVCLSLECGPGEQRALLWTDGAAYDLNNLISAGSGWTLFSAEAINESGEIVGTGARQGYASIRAFRLTPQTSSVEGSTDQVLQLKLAPNPLQGDGDLYWNQECAGDARLKLFNASGRQVAARRMASLEAGPVRLPLSELTGGLALANGTYWVELVASDGSRERTRITLLR